MKIFFAHANGFPPEAYAPFLSRLEGEVHAAPLFDFSSSPPAFVPWADLVDDAPEDVVLLGHSLGASALAMSARRLRGRALIMIEPAMVTWWQARVIQMAPWWVKSRIEPARSTLRKRDRWPDQDAFLASCKKAGIYKRMDADAMAAFARAALRPEGGEMTLRFPKLWEARIYMSAPNPVSALARYGGPVVGIRGRSSMFLDDKKWADVVRAAPEGTFIQREQFGHLMPLEAPRETADLVNAHLGPANK